MFRPRMTKRFTLVLVLLSAFLLASLNFLNYSDEDDGVDTVSAEEIEEIEHKLDFLEQLIEHRSEQGKDSDKPILRQIEIQRMILDSLR